MSKAETWAKAPAVQFYFKDWLDHKVQRMSDAAQGVYMRLLAHIWTGTANQYRIKDDNKTLSKTLGLSARMWLKYRREIQADRKSRDGQASATTKTK